MSADRTCIHCKYDLFNSSSYVVYEAIKPKGMSNRLKRIGECCEDCKDSGKSILVDKFKSENHE